MQNATRRSFPRIASRFFSLILSSFFLCLSECQVWKTKLKPNRYTRARETGVIKFCRIHQTLEIQRWLLPSRIIWYRTIAIGGRPKIHGWISTLQFAACAILDSPAGAHGFYIYFFWQLRALRCCSGSFSTAHRFRSSKACRRILPSLLLKYRLIGCCLRTHGIFLSLRALKW